MGIALEKQKRDDKPVKIDEYKSMFSLLLKHSLLDKRFVNTRPIGHEVSCYGCSKAANGNTYLHAQTNIALILQVIGGGGPTLLH